ncbi:hypothetical protein, partial [Kibdelosporangium aridum]|uniref:hypothetical protein n=1 Tax=Kibdelosporangium aridum TaxID=2030 RepID=UPI001C8C106A
MPFDVMKERGLAPSSHQIEPKVGTKATPLEPKANQKGTLTPQSRKNHGMLKPKNMPGLNKKPNLNSLLNRPNKRSNRNPHAHRNLTEIKSLAHQSRLTKQLLRLGGQQPEPPPNNILNRSRIPNSPKNIQSKPRIPSRELRKRRSPSTPHQRNDVRRRQPRQPKHFTTTGTDTGPKPVNLGPSRQRPASRDHEQSLDLSLLAQPMPSQQPGLIQILQVIDNHHRRPAHRGGILGRSPHHVNLSIRKSSDQQSRLPRPRPTLNPHSPT